MSPEEKAEKIRDAAKLGAAFFTELIEQRVTRDDAMSMVNSMVVMFLITEGVIRNPNATEPPEPWQK